MSFSISSSSNPVLSARVLNKVSFVSGNTMTIKGAVNKCLILFSFLLAAALLSWRALSTVEAFSVFYVAQRVVTISSILGLVIALVATFAKKLSPILSPLYTVCEGVCLGSLSMLLDTIVPGIAFKAMLLTFCILGFMLIAYRTGAIKVTSKFKAGVIIATGGIALMYIVSFVLNLCGIPTNYLHQGGTLSICISLVIVAVAALNLILDFDAIVQAANSNMPKYMEWYTAFGLMVTIVWLYIEIIRLLLLVARRR